MPGILGHQVQHLHHLVQSVSH